MPPVNVPSSDYLAQQINLMQQQIQALQTQQQYVMVDKNGYLRLQLGLLQNGDFGILLADTNGNSQELLPAASAFYGGTLATTSGSYTTLGSSPTVQVVIGESGDCEVTFSCIAAAAAYAGEVACATLVVDGSIPFTNYLCYLSSSGSNGAGASTTSIIRYKAYAGGGLAPGPHTFSLKYRALAGSGADFINPYLKVQPL
jgi:hypothetical protein